MTNLIKKHSISPELARKMVNAAVAKGRQLGVSENVAILDDGGNLKAFSPMDGAPIPTIEIAQNKAYAALFGVSTRDFFYFIQGDAVAFGRPSYPRTRAGVGWWVSHQGDRRNCRGDRVERSTHGAERRRSRENSPSALTRCGAC
jgi:hypothetical protein